MDNFYWAGLVCQAVPAPATPNNMGNVARWMAAENPPANWWRDNNPLNVADFTGPTNSFASLLAAAIATAHVIDQANMAPIAGALRADAPLAVFSAACHAAPWAIPGRYGSAGFIASIPLPPRIEAPGSAPVPTPVPPPPTPQEATDVTSWTTGGQNHVAGVVGGVAYHWWQDNTGATPPVWHVEKLPLS